MFSILENDSMNTPQRYILLTTFLLLAACTATPQLATKKAPATEVITVTAPNEPAKMAVTSFTGDTLYDLLVGDVALTRSAFDVALPAYLKQARQTLDAGVIEMAGRVASHLRDHGAALEMARLWVDVEPNNPESQNAALQAYGILDDALGALPHAYWLYRNEGDLDAFLAVTSIYKGPVNDDQSMQIQALIAAYQRLELPSDKQPAILLAVAILHRDNGQLADAEQTARAFLDIMPDDQRATLLLAQLLQQQDRIQDALRLVEETLSRKPSNRSLRLQYARFLTMTDRPMAIEQFEILHKQDPADQENNFLLALLLLNQGQIEESVELFTQASSKPNLRADAQFHLGGIAERKGNMAAALGHYREVRFGRNYLSAAARLTSLLAQHNGLTAARQYLQRQRKERPDLAVELFQVESNLLISAQQTDLALSILTAGLDAFPNDAQLLYARSMVAEQDNNFALAEQDLRALIAQDQNNATALNALGYTMILHTDRLDEAHTLIKRAYLLNPGDPATIDSMGWVLFQMGELAQALVHLKKAISIMPDPEIAAHLGEVLWALGEKADALETWTKGLQQSQGHKTIVSTMQRLGADIIGTESQP